MEFVLLSLGVPAQTRAQESAANVDLYGGVLPEPRDTVADKAGALEA